MILRIAACDDNKEEMSSLLSLIEEIMKGYSISYHICKFTSGEELLASDLSFHLIFLDIMLGDKNGIEIGNYIYRKNRNIKIIFQTNYSQYCKEAMNRSHAFAFLEKPLQKEEVEEQLIEFIENNAKHEKIRADFTNVVFMRNGKKIRVEAISLPVNDIIYFEYMKTQKRIRIVTERDEFMYSDMMNVLEIRMRPLGFETSCRGILVNLEKIVKIKRYTIMMSNDDCISLSQRRAIEFKERMNEYIHDSL